MKAFFQSRLAWAILFVVLVLNLGVFGAGYRYLSKVDEDYSRLLNEGIPLLSDLQTATVQASRAYALLVDLSRATTEEEIAPLEAELLARREVTDRIFAVGLQGKPIPAELMPAFDEIRKSRQEGKVRLSAFLSLVHRHDPVAASAFLQRVIYPEHKTYLGRLDAFCDLCQASFVAVHRQLASENVKGRSIFLGMAAAPLALLIGMAATALLSMIVLIVISMGPVSRPRLEI